MDRKGTVGTCQILRGKLVCWSVKKQQSVAMSFVEAEYVVAAGVCANILWMKSQLGDYDINYKMVPIFCDNTCAIAISNNHVLHSKTNHIDTRTTTIENTQVTMQSNIAPIKTNTSTMKEMVTEMFNAFKGFSSSTPSSSIAIPTIILFEATTTIGGDL
nr:uncharacterized mitochondrial protein AtMg00810-like [Tanacetum cinerariifolium]